MLFATEELPEQIRKDLEMMAGCIAGVQYVEDIRTMLQNAGFENIKMIAKDNSKEIIKAWTQDKNVEEFVASYVIEADKMLNIKRNSSCCSPTDSNRCC